MSKKKIIFDTDIGGDCDDAGALALLHRLCDLGEAELLATTHCFSSPYVAGCLDAINTYYGRQASVGINHAAYVEDGGKYAKALCEAFPNRYPSHTASDVQQKRLLRRKCPYNDYLEGMKFYEQFNRAF